MLGSSARSVVMSPPPRQPKVCHITPNRQSSGDCRRRPAGPRSRDDSPWRPGPERTVRRRPPLGCSDALVLSMKAGWSAIANDSPWRPGADDREAVPFGLFGRIGVVSRRMAGRAGAALATLAHRPDVEVRTDKRHWRSRSRPGDVEAGLGHSLRRFVASTRARSPCRRSAPDLEPCVRLEPDRRGHPPGFTPLGRSGRPRRQKIRANQ